MDVDFALVWGSYVEGYGLNCPCGRGVALDVELIWESGMFHKKGKNNYINYISVHMFALM